MSETSQFLVKHGAPFLFSAILLEQLGLPLPAVPWLLAAGALSANGNFNPIQGVVLTVIACLTADALWFYLGRYRGQQVLGFMCRISLEPDSCVRRTQNMFTRYGLRGVVVAKFLPGLSTMAPPLAGMSGVGAGRFFVADGIGSVLYGSSFISMGMLFRNQIDRVVSVISNTGGSVLAIVAGLFAVYIASKFWRRQRVLRELRMARITAEELRQKQTAGEILFILDLRSTAELELDPSLIQGALHFGVDDVEHCYSKIPRDREVIVYCSCPNEVTSARLALQLRRKGITRVRPLLGGINAWRELKYPLELHAQASPSTANAVNQ